MKRINRPVIHVACMFACLIIAPWSLGQESDKKILTVDEYGRWKRITSASLSADGAWMSYAYVPNEGDGTLHLKSLTSDSVYEIAVGSGPNFSNDSAWVSYMVSPPEKETEKLRKANKPVVRKLELLNLATGEKAVFDGAGSARFSEDSKFIAIKKNKSDRSAKHNGTDLLVRDLPGGVTRNIGNVGAFAFNETGDLLAFTVDAADKHGNGAYLLELATGVLRPLDTSEGDYTQLTWDEEGTNLAVLRGVKDEKRKQADNTVLVYRDVATRREARSEYDPSKDESFPTGMVVSELGGLSFSEDGSMLFIGIKEQEAEPKKNDDERANVDVWHFQDERVQSVQQRRANGDRRATFRCVLHLGGKSARFVQLAADDMRTVTIAGKGRWGVGRDDAKYRREITWGGSRADYYRVDLDTGERKPITASLGRAMGNSPDGKWFIFLKGGQVWAHNLDDGTTSNISKSAPVNFVNEGDDHPYEKPAYGVAGWTADGESVILNHKFDLWQLPLRGGEAVNMTAGVGDAQQIRFRYTNLDREAETIDTTEPLLLSAYGEWTKKSGYYTLTVGEEPEPLIFEDKSIGRPSKAKDADTVMLTMQTFVDFPDYWVTNTRFENPRRITDANPQQAEYAWGRRVLVDYENGDGLAMQATLALPAGYEEGTRYPMLVYFYEKMSQRHHQYSAPRFDDRPHMSTYASDGYLVLMPDVVYKTGRPGDSAVDCVTSAVKQVIELGLADPERIVLQGHSWGGYQSSFILTQTDIFAAVVTGAPVTNLVSFYNELYKSSGNVQQGIMERGQVRMGTTPWENMELYHSQSPLHNVQNITTPFIILHGTEDGSVDWHQGLEYYNAARRHGKEVILLSYPGEGHHLSQKPNQIDFQIRMKQFFDHYCKNTPAPSWMTDGVPFLKKDTASVRPKPESIDPDSGGK